MMRRILIPIDSHDAQSWNYALAHVDKLGELRGTHGDVILLVHTKNLITGSVLSGHIGNSSAKALSAGKLLRLPFGGNLRLASLKTLGHNLKDAIIIAFFADEKMLGVVDDRNGLAGVIAVPDFPGAADSWAERWTATIHGQPQSTAKRLIGDRVVESALRDLTKSINLSTGLGHPRDKETANETLRILRYKGHEIDTANLRSWAIQNGWRSDDAQSLVKLAEKIISLKSKPSMSKIYNWQERYEAWTE